MEKWNFQSQTVKTLHYEDYNTGEKDLPAALCVITDILCSLAHIFQLCDYILVEQQRKISPKNMCIMHHIISALLIITPQSIIVEIPSKYKTQLLNCPKGVNIKKWSPYMVFNVFRERGDKESYRKMKATRKRDDLADIVLQILAFLVKCGFLDAPDKLTGRQLQKVITLCQ